MQFLVLLLCMLYALTNSLYATTAIPKTSFEQKLEKIMHAPVKKEEAWYTVTLPRNNMHVSVDGFYLTPAMELNLELNFAQNKSAFIMMGELVFFEHELKLIEQIFLKQGITITAIHNHFIRDTPKILFIHFMAHGDALKLAQAMRELYDQLIQTSQNKAKLLKLKNPTLSLSKLNEIFKTSGQLIDHVYRYDIERPDLTITDHNHTMEAETWFTFQGSDAHAAVAGEIALRVPQVNAFITEIIKHNIEVVALHNHMLTEKPRIIYVHIWGTGAAVQLAIGCKAALNTITSQKK